VKSSIHPAQPSCKEAVRWRWYATPVPSMTVRHCYSRAHKRNDFRMTRSSAYIPL
jgi:hypothetical protein